MVDWHKVKLQIIAELKYDYGSREAENIARYYADAKRGADNSSDNISQDINLLKKGIPVQYVTGTSYFYKHEFYVDPSVLIPRPETEELVGWIISDIVEAQAIDIIDVGVGSGCILLSVIKEIDYEHAFGLDVSEAALEVFIKNAAKLDLICTPILCNILTERIDQKFDVIVSNPPYILNTERARMDDSVVIHEPDVALFVDNDDPLIFYKAIIEFAKSNLKPEGSLYFETSDLYHEKLELLIGENNLGSEFRKDMQGNWRMLKLSFD